MKKIILILIGLLIVTGVGYSQKPIKRKEKEKTEQTQSSEAKRKQEAEAKRKREAEERQRQEAEAKRRQEEERQRQEAEAKRKQEAEERQRQEAEAKRKQEAEERQRQEAEAKRWQTGVVNGHGYVDLGLSVKWATCNVGASTPSDYGDYFAWGETKPKSRYDWYNCFDCLNPKKWEKDKSWGVYKLGGKTQITPTSGHDTARENWGGAWRMPTVAELDELSNRCKWTWTTKNGHKGYTVTGPNGNSIFLPAAGYRSGADAHGVGEYGYYWSSTLISSYSYIARCLSFNDGNHNTNSFFYRSDGRSVRPVIE